MSRDDDLYPKLFGVMQSGVYPLIPEQFKNVFGVDGVDPLWLNVTVCVSPASTERPHWLYATSGLSDAFCSGQVDAFDSSHSVTEFLLQVEDRSDWAIALLQRLAIYQLLLGIGHFSGQPPLTFWHTVQPGGPIDGGTSSLTKLLLTPSIHYPGTYDTSAGKLAFIQIIGITAAEFDFGREQGFTLLFERLRSAGVVPVLDRYRPSIQ